MLIIYLYDNLILSYKAYLSSAAAFETLADNVALGAPDELPVEVRASGLMQQGWHSRRDPSLFRGLGRDRSTTHGTSAWWTGCPLPGTSREYALPPRKSLLLC